MELIKHLSAFYHESVEVCEIQSSLDMENRELRAAIADLLDQLFVLSASWGLEYWEKYFDLSIDKAENLQTRRSRIMTRLRGRGTTTKEMLQNVCASFSGGEVAIIENFAEHSFVIKFVGTIGRPANLDYLSASIDEIKPAHLVYVFEFTYNTHSDLSVFTYNQLATRTHFELRERLLQKNRSR